MARTLTNNFQLSCVAETALGTADTSGWEVLEVNKVTKYGATIKKKARAPITKNRQRRKGGIVGLDSAVEFDQEATMGALKQFTPAFLFAHPNGPGLANGVPFRPTAVTGTGYTVAAGGDLADGTLVRARGFTTAANNGLKLLAGTSTATEVKCAGLTAEAAPPSNATLEVCGIQGTATEFSISAAGNLVAATVDMTTLGLTVGQWIWVGGALAGAFVFNTAANRGLARITAISTTTLTLDKKATTFATDAGTGKTIQVFFGTFVRNVSKDDTDFLERSYTFEGWFEDLGGATIDKFEYAKGNYAATFGFNIPLEDLVTMEMTFVGTDTDNPVVVASRKTGASTARQAVETAPLNSTSDVINLRTMEGETEQSASFKSAKLMINNNVGPEKLIGTLGAAAMNYGKFEVDIESVVWFDNSTIIDSIRDNDTLTMDWAFRNTDGGVVYDIPSMTLEGGDKDMPENETILMSTTAMAFQDATLGYSLGVSFFPYLPLD